MTKRKQSKAARTATLNGRSLSSQSLGFIGVIVDLHSSRLHTEGRSITYVGDYSIVYTQVGG
jgi:hypothetical protein